MTQVMPNTAPVAIDWAKLNSTVSKAKSVLYMDYPFFGMAVAKRPIIWTETVTQTAAMSATGQMYLNPHFVGTLTVRQVIFLLAHEGLHYMLGHSLRLGTRIHTAWNICCDKVINDVLIFEKVGDFIVGGILHDGARDMAAEELYDENDADDWDKLGPIGNDVGPPCNDDGRPMCEADVREHEARVKVDVIQASKEAKARGRLPASIERLVDKIVNVSTPWNKHLEPYMMGKVRDGKSWNMPNQKYISTGLYLKGKHNLPKLGTVVIVCDTSGSIGQAELNEFNGHGNRILETCNPERVIVIYCDDEVNSTEEYEADDYPVTLKLQGGGGTSFKPAFDWIDENSIDPEVVIYLTDGFGDQDSFTSKHETVWLTTHRTEFTWGKVIKFESESEAA